MLVAEMAGTRHGSKSPAPIPDSSFSRAPANPPYNMFAAVFDVARLRAPKLYFLRSPLLHVSKLFCVRIPPDSGAVNTQFAPDLRTLTVCRIGARAGPGTHQERRATQRPCTNLNHSDEGCTMTQHAAGTASEH